MGDKPRLTAVGSNETPPAAPRPRSTVAFPYTDLGQAERAAQLVAESLGRCRPEQLAAWLGHSVLNSGAFRNKVAAAKLFGVVQGARNVIELTALGRRLVDHQTARQSRVEAFLSVPLYLSIFQSHRGRRLPGNLGLELEMLRLGVARTQVKTARQVFVRSAEQAGFFESGANQMVLPRETVFPVPAPEQAGGSNSPGRPAPAGYPNVIQAILEQAPWNSVWTEEEFEAWAGLFVQAARVHFRSAGSGGA